MKLPKINWLTVASFAAMIVGGIVDEIRHQQELEELEGKLKNYVDNGCTEPPEETEE